MISGDLTTEPVLIESGQTYEKEVIKRYLEIQHERAAAEKQDLGDEWTEEIHRNFFRCPVTQKHL